jgi:hypothetical protein
LSFSRGVEHSVSIDLGSDRVRARTRLGSERRFLLALAATSLALFGLLFGFRDLPMVDLPQHAAQITTWLHWGDPAYPNADIEINLRTPYLLAYFFAKTLTPVLGVVSALKLVVLLAAVGNGLALGALARRLGHDPWLGLLGVPTTFGYSFYFGFLTFVSAVPLGVWCLLLALEHGREPRWRRGLALAALACLTLVAHGVACAITLCSALPILLANRQAFLACVAPLFAPVLLAIVWLAPGSSMSPMGETIWVLGLYRLADLPAALISFNAHDRFGMALGLCVLATVLLSVGKASRVIWHFMPLSLVLTGFFLFPASLNGYGFMGPRFAAFLLPALLLAFRPRSAALASATSVSAKEASSLPRRAAPATEPSRGLDLLQTKRGLLTASLIGGLTLVWLVLFGVRLAAFNRESAPFHALLASLEPGLRVRSIVFDRASSALPGVPVFLHFAAYYLVEKAGVLGHAFTMYPNSVLRLRPGAHSLTAPGSEWVPQSFDAVREGPLFDYFLVRSAVDRKAQLFGVSSEVVLESRAGSWWAYRVAGAGDI